MTTSGGSSSNGTIFSIGIDGSEFQTLLSFSGMGGAYVGSGGIGSLTVSGTTLYGMTTSGGNGNYGTVFKVGADGSGFQNLLIFNVNNGKLPAGSLTLSGTTLYGMTPLGGNGGSNDYGTVFSLTVSGANRLNYTVGATVQSGSATLGAITSATGSLASGASQSCTVSATSTKLGVTTISFTGSDPTSSNLSQTTTATLTVLDHAAAAFAGGGGTLNLDFGTLQLGSGTRDLQFQIENLPAAYRAGLALESVMALSDPGGVFSTDAVPFSDLAAGTTTSPMDLFLNTSQLGNFSGQYQFNLSDEQDLSGWAGGQTLTLNVTADVVPEPSTLALLAVGAIGLVVSTWRTRIRSRDGLGCPAASRSRLGKRTIPSSVCEEDRSCSRRLARRARRKP